MKKLTIISIMVFAFLTLTKSASGQCFNYTVNNNTGCEWQIDFFDGTNTGIAAASYLSFGGTTATIPASNCLGCGNSNTWNGKFVFSNNGCSYTIYLPAGGSITPTGCTFLCSGMGPTTTLITINVITGGATCTNEYNIDIN